MSKNKPKNVAKTVSKSPLKHESIAQANGTRRWRLDLGSLTLGIGLTVAANFGLQAAFAFDISAVTKSVTNLINIKKNLDSDVKNLTGDAKKLLSSKDNLIQIKDKLVALAKDTKSQVDSIQGLVSEVEGQLKKTQDNIGVTAGHVGEIDQVRKSLSGH